MIGLILSGLIVTLTTLALLARTNLRRWLGYSSFVDVAFTVILVVLFAGTYSGVVAAAFSGLWMSALLLILRRYLGCEKLAVRRVSWRAGFIRLHWKSYKPADLTWFGIRS